MYINDVKERMHKCEFDRWEKRLTFGKLVSHTTATDATLSTSTNLVSKSVSPSVCQSSN